ncbi:MAG: nucleotidyltransferase family protein [Candidatus Nitrosocaldus sp.]
MKAVILAGGFGKRLKPLTDDRPKPMVEILGKPIVAWQVEWLRLNGIYELILCVGYMKERIMDYLGDGSKYSVSIDYVVEDEPLGTGGAVKNARHMLKDDDKGKEEEDEDDDGYKFIVVNGDIITDLNIGKMLAFNGNSIAVVPLPSPYGIVEISNDSKIIGFKEKPKIDQFWINAGVYCLTSEVFKYLPEKGSIEYDTFPKLAADGMLYAVKYRDAYWRSIDTHKDVEEASKELLKYKRC